MIDNTGHRLVTRGGASWRVGTDTEVAWINAGTTVDLTITSAIPPVFDAYATIVLPDAGQDQRLHDRALIALLREQSPDQPWWLGYLDSGGGDLVFPNAPRVTLYADWPYVLAQAGPEQAADWRRCDGPRRTRGLPELMFPLDRSWLVSTLWDDDWTCVGGSDALVAGLLNHPDLRCRGRQVNLDEDATPPGHQAI